MKQNFVLFYFTLVSFTQSFASLCISQQKTKKYIACDGKVFRVPDNNSFSLSMLLNCELAFCPKKKEMKNTEELSCILILYYSISLTPS